MSDVSLQAALEFLDSWLNYRARQVAIPGFCVAIYEKDALVFSHAYGLANIERNESLTTKHLFGMASQSKMFAATAILQLVNLNKLRLDDRVCQYLPWLTSHSDKRFTTITVRQLLTHSAGLIRDGLDADFWGLKQSFPSHAGLHKTILATDIALEPNITLKYSNLGFALLGELVEALSGQSYTEFVTNHIIKPLKLKNTFADYNTPTLRKRLATAYSIPFEYQRLPLEPRKPTKAFAAAVGIHSTVEDMCRFASSQFMGNDTLLNDQLKREMQRSQRIVNHGYDEGMEFGLGCEVMHINKRRVVGHGGHLAGFLTATYFDPDKHLAVSVAANAKDAPSTQIVRGIFEALDWFAEYANTPTPKSLARFSTRLYSATATVEVVATKKRIAAIDPDDWEPFTWLEELKRIDSETLRVTTPGSIFNEGELICYKFAGDVLQAVRYAGFTMLPEFIHRQLANSQQLVTLDDLQYVSLRIGRVAGIEPCNGPLPYRLLIDFGPEFGIKPTYLAALPQATTKEMLRGRPVLGAIFSIWHHSDEIVTLGLAANSRQPSALLTPGSLVLLAPDPRYPQTLWREAASKRGKQYVRELKRGFFKLQALPEYPIEDTDFSTPSLSAWLLGKHRKAIALLEKYQEAPPFWLNASRQNIRILLTDESLAPYSQWTIEFLKRIAIPLGETVYLLPRKSLATIDLPQGDFTIWDNKRVTVNGYAQGHWTHTTAYDIAAGNNIGTFLQLKRQLSRLAITQGQKLIR